MKGWQEVTIGQLCNIKHGWAFKGEFFSDKGSYFLLTPGNFQPTGGLRIRANKEKYYLGQFPDEYLLNKGDLLVVMTDLIQTAPILGGSAIVPENGMFLHNQRLGKVVDINTDRTCKEFLYWVFNFEGYRAQIRGSASGSTVRHTAPERICKSIILLPPLSIQQKIANILSAYDDLIENNLKRIKLLEEMAQITYEEWFVRFRFPGYETTQINPETGLPEGWEKRAIATICSVNKNSISMKKAPEKIRYIDISSAETGSYAPPQEMRFITSPSRARRRVEFGDTIFSTVRPNRKIFSLILEDDPILVASTGFAVLKPHRAQNYPFIYLTISQQCFTDAAVAVAGGAAYPAVNQTDFERIKITVPTQELMDNFSDIFFKNFIVKGLLQKENQRLREARDILLPRLMTGMIDVESYDPTKLLEGAA